jgi:hypothetical protein
MESATLPLGVNNLSLAFLKVVSSMVTNKLGTTWISRFEGEARRLSPGYLPNNTGRSFHDVYFDRNFGCALIATRSVSTVPAA